MQVFYVSTVSFYAFILVILLKIHVTEFTNQTYHGWRWIYICDYVNSLAISSEISALVLQECILVDVIIKYNGIIVTEVMKKISTESSCCKIIN